MRSQRRRFEIACRIGAFAVLGWLLGSSILPSTPRTLERASSADIATRLAAWARAPASTVLHGDFASVPETWVVDWLAALRHSNHIVSWSGSPPAVALSAEAVTDPDGGVRVDIAAPQGSRVALHDGGGMIDSVQVAGFGASVVTPVVIGSISALVGDQRAEVATPEPATTRSVVVIGGASWEGKFIVSALEERGWSVVAKFAVAPNVDVGQSTLAAFDTARVAAIIVIDTVAQSQAAALERFVRAGGGLVLAGTSSKSLALRSLAPGMLGARTRPAMQASDTIRLGSTGFYPVASLNAGGIALERRQDGIALAAKRIGAGRVIQVGYDDSWRWRMAGANGSERAHREWWSRIVSSVAYVPGQPRATLTTPVESAPLARLIDRLGVARAEPPGNAFSRPDG